MHPERCKPKARQGRGCLLHQSAPLTVARHAAPHRGLLIGLQTQADGAYQVAGRLLLYRQLIGAPGALVSLLDKQPGQLPVLLRPAILLAIEALIVLVLGDGHEGRLVLEAHIAQPRALGLKDKHAGLLQ